MLSRFDIVLTLNVDESGEKFVHDLKIANFLTEKLNSFDPPKLDEDECKNNEIWSQEMLKAYIVCAKEIVPVMSDSAER